MIENRELARYKRINCAEYFMKGELAKAHRRAAERFQITGSRQRIRLRWNLWKVESILK